MHVFFFVMNIIIWIIQLINKRKKEENKKKKMCTYISLPALDRTGHDIKLYLLPFPHCLAICLYKSDIER